MKKKLFTLIAMLSLVGLTNAQIRPLQLISKSDYADMTQHEKEIYVTGVLEGQAFILYGSKSPDLKPFTDCVKTEGIKKITLATDTMAVMDEVMNPIPWAVARAIGAVCKKYR
jgi:hypothetical protein